MADPLEMTLKYVGTTVLVSIASRYTRRTVKCSSVLPEIDISDIVRHNLSLVESMFGLGITMQVEYFQAAGKWLYGRDAIYSLVRRRDCIFCAVAKALLVIL